MDDQIMGFLWTKCNMQQCFLWICDNPPTTPQNQNQVCIKSSALQLSVYLSVLDEIGLSIIGSLAKLMRIILC